MKQASVLLQIILFASGIAVGVFYVYPEFTTVNENQNLIQEYEEAAVEASEVRSLLSRLQQERDNMNETDRAAIATYLPTEQPDIVSVQRDLYNYVQRYDNLQLTNLTHGTDARRGGGADQSVLGETFSISVSGDYQEVKALIVDLENNNYPLRFREINLSADQLGFIDATFEVTTYWYPSEG